MKLLITLFSVLLAAVAAHGQTWTSQPSGTTRNINAIWAVSPGHVQAVGQSGGSWRTVDSGRTWTAGSTNTTRILYGLHFLDSLTGFACGENLELRRTTNGGRTWSGFGAATGLSDLYDLSFTAANVGWTVGEVRNGFGFFYNPISNNTRQLTPAEDRNLKAIWFANANNGWAVGDNGVVLKFASSGVNWSRQNTGATQTLNDIAFFATDRGVAVGNRGTIIRTTNGGSQWFNTTSPTTQDLNGVFFADDTLVFAVGNNGMILRSSNGGQTWVRETTSLTTDLRAVHGTDAHNVWVCGDGGVILKRGPAAVAAKDAVTKPRLELYPSPAHGRLTVTSDKPLKSLRVYNLLGEAVLTAAAAGLETTLNVAALTPGAYLLEARTSGSVQVRKFVKE